MRSEEEEGKEGERLWGRREGYRGGEAEKGSGEGEGGGREVEREGVAGGREEERERQGREVQGRGGGRAKACASERVPYDINNRRP